MEIDGGNLDDDNIEREWLQLTVLTSLYIKDENDGKKILTDSLKSLFFDFINRYKDVKKHFLKKEKKSEEEIYEALIKKCLEKMEI